MGYDVYGNNPASKAGEEFCKNVWRWPPLAELCIDTAPKVCANCKYWFSNDGDGLDAHDAAELAMALQARLNANRISPDMSETVTQFIAFLRDSGGFKIC